MYLSITLSDQGSGLCHTCANCKYEALTGADSVQVVVLGGCR